MAITVLPLFRLWEADVGWLFFLKGRNSSGETMGNADLIAMTDDAITSVSIVGAEVVAAGGDGS